MIRLFLGLALAAAVSPAYSADLFVEQAPVVEVSDNLFDWTGLYVGLQAGYVSGVVETEDWFCVNDPGECYEEPEDRYFADLNISGFRGGAHLGYNQQFGSLVFGAETQLNLGGASGEGGFVYFDESEGEEFPGNEDESATFDTLWEGSTRLKLGFALDRLMPYVTGGLAYGQADITAQRDFDIPLDFEYSGINLIGYTIGLGAAYAVTDEIIIRGEANYTDYGSTTAAGVDPVEVETHDIEVVGPKYISVEAGISFKF